MELKNPRMAGLENVSLLITGGMLQVPPPEEIEVRAAQIRATIYGQCVGDTIGLLTEFLTKGEAKTHYKEKDLEYSMKIADFHRKRWKIGDWTDDSDQMLLILLSLLDHQGEVNVQDFAQKMKHWMQRGFTELGDVKGMGIGQTTHTVLNHRNFAALECWDTNGRNIASNGGVMRTSVVGTHCWWDVPRVYQTALEFVRCTHYDMRCQASAVAVSVCISLMLQRQPRHMDGHTYKVKVLIKDTYKIAANRLATDKDAALECWDTNGRNIASNGGVMRTSVVGTHCWWDVPRVYQTALEFVRCTHYDMRCQASAVAVSVCISLMLQRQPRHMDGHTYKVKVLIKDTYKIAANRLATDKDKKKLWKYMSCKKIKKLKLGQPGKIGYTYKSMGCGFWAFKQDDFRKAIQKVVMEGGDADSNACVAGAMLGCKLGLDNIPQSWKTQLLHKDWLDQHIERWLMLQKELAAKDATLK